ncbi:MAG: fibronectin type III domain-containing protein [Candidatus Sumerlaeota bacterium]|nr:fibronectin type III domain-containing protein [Candidatus Sumerlaeota bacterium]
MTGFATAQNHEQEGTGDNRDNGEEFFLCSLHCLLFITSTTATSSEYEITGLTRGQQYWVRVRAVRAGQPGPWSDQATRVANI